MSTAVSCTEEAAGYVGDMVRDYRAERGIKGAIDKVCDLSGVSFWKIRKLWNPNLQKHGFTWEADEHRALKVAYHKHMAALEARIQARLDEVRRIRSARLGEGESQCELGLYGISRVVLAEVGRLRFVAQPDLGAQGGAGPEAVEGTETMMGPDIAIVRFLLWLPLPPLYLVMAIGRGATWLAAGLERKRARLKRAARRMMAA